MDDRWDWDVWSGDEVCTLHTTSDGDKKNRRVSSMLVSRHVRTLSADSKYPFSFCVCGLDVENLLDTRRDDIFCLPWIHELGTIVTYATPRWSCGDGRKEMAC